MVQKWHVCILCEVYNKGVLILPSSFLLYNNNVDSVAEEVRGATHVVQAGVYTSQSCSQAVLQHAWYEQQ
eukprot:122477-Pelagomonas_calceolata.AAC.2